MSERPKPAFGLVKSFSAKDYPHRIRITLGFDPANSHIDHMFKDSLDYRWHKPLCVPEQKMRDIRAIMKKGAVDDYCLFREGNDLELRLRNYDDAMIAYAGLNPRNLYSFDFVQCEDRLPTRKIKKRAQAFSKIFNQTSMAGKVSFTVDKERRVIKGHVNNGDHYVHFWGVARTIEQQLGL